MRHALAIAGLWSAGIIVGVTVLVLARDYRKFNREIESLNRMWRRSP